MPARRGLQLRARTAIVGGTVVAPDGSRRADVLVEDGLIRAVGEVDRDGAETVDAGGCLVLPGAIDVHTHVFGGVRDDTRSALCGGTTSALAFVDALPGERPAEAARRTLADEMPESLIDLALHAVIWEPQAYRHGDLAEAAALGIGSVKLWLAYLELASRPTTTWRCASYRRRRSWTWWCSPTARTAVRSTCSRGSWSSRDGWESIRCPAAARSSWRPSACTGSWCWPGWPGRCPTSCT